jgi:hypothetical protein
MKLEDGKYALPVAVLLRFRMETPYTYPIWQNAARICFHCQASSAKSQRPVDRLSMQPYGNVVGVARL